MLAEATSGPPIKTEVKVESVPTAAPPTDDRFSVFRDLLEKRRLAEQQRLDCIRSQLAKRHDALASNSEVASSLHSYLDSEDVARVCSTLCCSLGFFQFRAGQVCPHVGWKLKSRFELRH
jgi:hypothetical protein